MLCAGISAPKVKPAIASDTTAITIVRCICPPMATIIRRLQGCWVAGRTAPGGKAGGTAGRTACPPTFKLQRLVALPGRVAFVVVDDFAVRAEAVVSVLAPEEPVVAVLDRGVPLGFDELALPVEVVAPVHADVGQSGEFHTIPFRLRP